MNQYYIITGAKNGTLIITKNYLECFDFIVKNKDSKVRTIGASAKPRILDRRDFLREFILNTKDDVKFFILTEILIKRGDNFRKFLNSCDLIQEYRKYKENNSKVL